MRRFPHFLRGCCGRKPPCERLKILRSLRQASELFKNTLYAAPKVGFIEQANGTFQFIQHFAGRRPAVPDIFRTQQPRKGALGRKQRLLCTREIVRRKRRTADFPHPLTQGLQPRAVGLLRTEHNFRIHQLCNVRRCVSSLRLKAFPCGAVEIETDAVDQKAAGERPAALVAGQNQQIQIRVCGDIARAERAVNADHRERARTDAPCFFDHRIDQPPVALPHAFELVSFHKSIFPPDFMRLEIGLRPKFQL